MLREEPTKSVACDTSSKRAACHDERELMPRHLHFDEREGHFNWYALSSLRRKLSWAVFDEITWILISQMPCKPKLFPLILARLPPGESVKATRRCRRWAPLIKHPTPHAIDASQRL